MTNFRQTPERPGHGSFIASQRLTRTDLNLSPSMSQQWEQDAGHLRTDSPRFTQTCGNTAFVAGSHSFVLTGISIELMKDGKQAIVSLGSQVQTLSRERLRTESNRRSCESGQPSSQPSAATLSGGMESILPAEQGFHRWTPQQTTSHASARLSG